MCRFTRVKSAPRKAPRLDEEESGVEGGRREEQTAAEEAKVAGTRGAEKTEIGRGGGTEIRGFRTANYVNCRCCKLPSQFAFILHTIHTVSAHLARNPSTWILLLPPARRRVGGREGERGGRR